MESLTSPPTSISKDQVQSTQQQVITEDHYDSFSGHDPFKLLHDVLMAILKCLGFQGTATQVCTSSSEEESKEIVNEEETESAKTTDQEYSTSPPEQVSISTTDPPADNTNVAAAASDPPSSTGLLEVAPATAAFLAPSRLPVNKGSGPQKN